MLVGDLIHIVEDTIAAHGRAQTLTRADRAMCYAIATAVSAAVEAERNHMSEFADEISAALYPGSMSTKGVHNGV